MDRGILIIIADISDHKGKRNLEGNDHQIMFILKACGNEGVNTSRTCIEKLIFVSLVLDLKILNNIICFVSYEQVELDEVLEVVNIFINCLRLITDLNMLVLKQRAFLSKISNFKSS